MASIRTRQTTTKGDVHEIRYRTGGRQKTKTVQGSLRDAKRQAAMLETRLVEGSYIDPNQGRTTLAEWAKEWQAAQHHHRAETRRVVRGVITNHLAGLADRPLAAITQAEIQHWVRERSRGLAPSSLGQAYKWVATIFRAACEAQPPRLARTPCKGIKLPEAERELVRPVPVADVKAMAEAVPARYRALVLLAAATGMRFGELAGLTVDRVDWIRMSVLVDRQWTREAAFASPKSKASVRVIPVDEGTIAVLARHLEEFGPGQQGHVFTNSRSPLRETAFNKVWVASRAKVGLSLTVHDLRHFYASLLIRRGLDVKAVQAALGHKRASETLDTYGHLWGDGDSRIRLAVAATMEEETAVA